MGLSMIALATSVRFVLCASTNTHGQTIFRGRDTAAVSNHTDLTLMRYRHVRVHHVDKDKDDPLLREVLAQRPEGGPRGRRRRTGP